MKEFPRVLFEDNHLLVVEKPVNVPVQADVSGDEDLLSLCKQYVKERYQKPGEVYLALVHRLDRPVGGVMVFARTSKAAARLTSQFKGHSTKKRYAAIVRGKTPAQARLTDWLLKDDTTHSSSVVPEGTTGAKRAELSFETIGYAEGYSLLNVSLCTGRSHQIRVQLSHAGFPIAGDQRYCEGAVPGTQIFLWAYSLTIIHPTLGEEMTFFSLPPWKSLPEAASFGAQLELLPAGSVCSGVYLDDNIAVVDKHPGVEVESELAPALESAIGPVYPVHRLDAQTRGLIVFARNEASENTLLSAFRNHAGIRKEYEAILYGIPGRSSGRLENLLVKNAETGTVRIAEQKTQNAKTAVLTYEVTETRDRLARVRIGLMTGRTHQIRVQMAGIGCPVLGDDKYGNRQGNRAYRTRQLMLLSRALEIGGQRFESLRELPFPEEREGEA